MDSGNKDSKTVRCRTCECLAYNPVKNGLHTPKVLSVRDEVQETCVRSFLSSVHIVYSILFCYKFIILFKTTGLFV